MSKSAEFIKGFEAAEKLFYEIEQSPTKDNTDWPNPFVAGTDEYDGFEEGVYIFTQK